MVEICVKTDQYKYCTVRMNIGRNILEIEKFMEFVKAEIPQESFNFKSRKNGWWSTKKRWWCGDEKFYKDTESGK